MGTYDEKALSEIAEHTKLHFCLPFTVKLYGREKLNICIDVYTMSPRHILEKFMLACKIPTFL